MVKKIKGTYDLANISKNLIILRNRNGLSKKQLSAILNVSLRTVYEWEGGFKYPKLNNLIQIATLYQVSIERILL